MWTQMLQSKTPRYNGCRSPTKEYACRCTRPFWSVQGLRVEAELLTLWPILQVEYAEAKVQWLQELHERECAELEEMLAREYQERVLQEHEKVGWEVHCLICWEIHRWRGSG